MAIYTSLHELIRFTCEHGVVRFVEVSDAVVIKFLEFWCGIFGNGTTS
jgi:hypothetical protein